MFSGAVSYTHLHYTQLDPKDKKVFTKKIGIGTLLVSIGILVRPIINVISHSELGYYIGLIFLSLIHIFQKNQQTIEKTRNLVTKKGQKKK